MCRDFLQLDYAEACSILGFWGMWSKDIGSAGPQNHGGEAPGGNWCVCVCVCTCTGV